MPRYYSEAVTSTGDTVKVVIECKNEEEVAEQMRARGYYPLMIKLAPHAPVAADIKYITKPILPKQRQESFFKDLHSLQKKLIDGDDDAFEQIKNHVSSLNAMKWDIPDSFIQQLNKLKSLLEQYPSAKRYREALQQHKAERDALLKRAQEGDDRAIQELDLAAIGTGWLIEDRVKKPGDIVVFEDDLVFLEKRGSKTILRILCTLQDIHSARLKGIFSKRLDIKTSSGKRWSIKIDPAPSHFPPKYILRLIRILSKKPSLL